MSEIESTRPLLSIRNAGVRRKNQWLVQDINLDIRRGEIVTLIGPNGSGKSTTAKMALKILKPTTGSVMHASHLRIGYVPQKLSIDWTLPLSVADLLTLTNRLDKTQIADALAEVGLDNIADKQVHNLSGGELQRVLLARAIGRKPDFLVLDEPLQGVDYAGEAALYKLIAQIRDRLNCGILLISHDLHIVMAATDRVLCLNGHICCSGTPQSVAASQEYATLFGVGANQSLAIYQHHHDHEHDPDGHICSHHHH